jgi:uncharacterized protein
MANIEVNEIKKIIESGKTVAVVGLSDNEQRPSYQVALYLKERGFEIIPVNPTIQEWEGIVAVASISDIPADKHIDIVDIFRRSDDVPQIVDDVIASGRNPVIWTQEGVFMSPDTIKKAEEHGLTVVINRCMKKLHMAYYDRD